MTPSYAPLLVLTLTLACGHGPAKVPASAPSGAPSDAPSDVGAPSAAEPGDTVLIGTLVHKRWSKTMESWDAGGSDYFVLETGDETVVLQLTGPVTGEALLPLDGKKVELQGRMVEGKVPEMPPHSQYPMDMNGGPLPTGAGFRVSAARILP